MTVSQTAHKMNVSPATVRRLVKRGDLPHRRVGTQIRFVAEDIASYSTAQATAKAGGTNDWRAAMASAKSLAPIA